MLIIKTVNDRTDITDDRGNGIATLYGVGSILHDGNLLVECELTSIKIKKEITESLPAASGTVTKPSAKKKRKGK